MTFFNEQCKETEENSRRGKTRDLLKKTGNIKRIFHLKMGIIKDRNGKYLKEAEEIKKRWQEYLEELHKKDLNDPVHIMLKSSLKDFEHILTSMGDECNCLVV